MARETTDGTAARLDASTPFTSWANFTFAFWVFLSATPGANRRALVWGDSAALGWQTASTTLQWVDEGIAWRGAGMAISTGAWHHVAALRAGSGNVSLFLDGVANHNFAVTPNAAGATSRIMGVSAASASMPGRMAEVAAWDVSLGAAEVASLARGFSPLLIIPSSLRAYWPLSGNADPEPELVESRGATINGTITKADHPRIIVPRPAIYLP